MVSFIDIVVLGRKHAKYVVGETNRADDFTDNCVCVKGSFTKVF